MKHLEVIDESLFLHDFDVFRKLMLPEINRRRVEKGKLQLDYDESINYFLELRKIFEIDTPNEPPDYFAGYY